MSADAEPVSRLIFLTGVNSTTSMSVNAVRMVESQPRPLRCVSFSGYPPPSMAVYVGSRDVSTEFQLSRSVSLTSRRPGLRHINVHSERSTDQLDVTSDDDGSVMKCVATVAGLKPTVALIQLHVDCESPSLCELIALTLHKLIATKNSASKHFSLWHTIMNKFVIIQCPKCPCKT